MTFNMDVNLRVIRKDKDSMVNRKRQSCRNQRSEINATLDALGWDDIGFDERDEDKPKKISDTRGPLYTSSDTGFATGRVQKSRSRKPYYNPYGYPVAYAQPRSASNSNQRNIPRAVPVAPYMNPYGPFAVPMYPNPSAPPPSQNKTPATAGGGRTRKRSSKKSRRTRRVHFA